MRGLTCWMLAIVVLGLAACGGDKRPVSDQSMERYQKGDFAEPKKK